MIANAPVVFLQQGESEGGQIDALITPSGASRSVFINYTQFEINTGLSKEFSYHSPRRSFNLYAYGSECTETVEEEKGSDAVNNVTWRYTGDCLSSTYTCMTTLCPGINAQVNLQLIDSKKEKSIGLGRNWPFETIPSGSVLVHDSIARLKEIKKGDTIWTLIYLDNFWNPLISHVTASAMAPLGVDLEEARDILQSIEYRESAIVPLVVYDIYDDNKGKFASGDKYLVMEDEYFLPYVLNHMKPATTEKTIYSSVEGRNLTVSELISRGHPEQFVNSVSLNLPPSRVDVYVDTDYDAIQGRVISFVSRAMYYIGFPEIDVDMDILSSLFEIRFFTLFLGLILSIILTILCILSTMLIYSLLMISIETRTFELGVHRMVGMKRLGIIQMLMVQALSYAIPAWIFGLIFAQVLANQVLSSLEASVEVPIHKQLTDDAIIVGTCLGLLIPLVAALFPIRNALAQNLQDSLDTKHSKTMAVKVSIERSEDQGVSLPWIVLGIGLFVFGFLIYYLLPLSLLTFNLTLFFNIFFGILLAMLFGLILLSLNAEHMMERLVTGIFLWWESRPMRKIVLKNLVAHRLRNRKTTMMYALSLGFIIFITVAFKMELKTAEFRVLKQQGSRLRVSADDDDSIPYSEVIELETLFQTHAAVDKWTWVSQKYGSNKEAKQVWLTNLGHIMESKVAVYGVSPNFYDVAIEDFLIASRRDMDTGLSISEQLYTVRGSQSVVLPTSFLDSHALDDRGSHFLTATEIEDTDERDRNLELRRLKSTAFLDSTPVFLMSRFPRGEAEQDIVVSFPTLLRMSNGSIPTMEDVKMSALLFKLDDSASTEEVDDLVKELDKFAERHFDMDVWDFRDFKDSLDKTNAVMDLIFGIATYIAMFLCLFSLMASMYTNIFEQSKEIAILRAMGMTKNQIVRVFVYEAFVLVMAASILGILIGCIMAWTMMLQRVLFTQLPVSVEFPYILFLLVIVGALVCSVLASFGPARTLVNRSVAGVMRTVI